MEYYVIRFIKPLCLSLICVVSVYYLTKSMNAAVVISLIPLLLGWLGIMEGFAYGMAAVMFMTAAAWAVTPQGIKGVLYDHAVLAIASLNQEMKATP